MNDLLGSLLVALQRLILWLAGVQNPLAMQVEDGYRAAAVGCVVFLAGCATIATVLFGGLWLLEEWFG